MQKRNILSKIFSITAYKAGNLLDYFLLNGLVNIQSRYRSEVPRGFQEVKVPRLHDNGTGWW